MQPSIVDVLGEILDFLQTMPAFVYLIPAIIFFGVGAVPGMIATILFAIAPGVRQNLGIRTVEVKRGRLDSAIRVPGTIGWDLRAAYNWSAHALPYYTLGPEVTGNSVHSEWYANFGFDNHKGNCYVMAATFQKMAKLLGYDAHLVEGYIRTYNGRGRHGWVEIDMNGTTYVFDPNFEYGGYGNGYQINYGMSGTFKYIDYARVD